VVLAHSVRVTDPRYAAHLHSPTLITAAATELVIGSTNQSMDTFDQAPAGTLVEDHFLRWLAGLLGLPADANGIMTAGGTASNLLGLTLAREHAARRRGFQTRQDGLPPEARNWRIISSEAAHFSVRRAAALLGLGERAVVGIGTDDHGRLDLAALDTALVDLRSQGAEVIAFVGTAGTTDLGAIDPLDGLADRAASHGAWFHVDAAVGAGLALSDNTRPLLDGLGRADSVTADLHKLWWQPIGASALLVRDLSLLTVLREHHDYLNREDDEADGVLNLASRSLDTTRRFDALKVLVSLRCTGRQVLGAMVDHLLAHVAEAGQMITAHPDLELLAPTSTVSVVFRWNPNGQRSGVPSSPDNRELDRINTEIQRRLFASGQAVLGRTRHRGLTALKLTLINPTVGVADLRELIALITTEAELVATRTGQGNPATQAPQGNPATPGSQGNPATQAPQLPSTRQTSWSSFSPSSSSQQPSSPPPSARSGFPFQPTSSRRSSWQPTFSRRSS
jgi:L-2,4-diaminobutyrate decarboxylase